MKIEILTIFPQIFDGFKTESLLGKAQERGLLELNITNIRDFADLPHLHVDDSPYGGGAGMVFKAEPLIKAVESAKTRLPDGTVILLTPGGAPFTQKKASELAKLDQAIFICCRYEGIDQRVIELVVDQEISIGDYVLMGGEVAAMAVIEATLRLRPDVIGNCESTKLESFSQSEGSLLLEAPHYTKPAEVRGLKVPEVLLSGDHAKIERWRKEMALEATKTKRPDLI